MTETVPCPLCRSSHSTPHLQLQDGLRIVECHQCHHFYTSPRLTEGSRAEIYNGEYFHSSSDTNMNLDYVSSAPVFSNDANERYQLLARYLPPAPAQILEIGSAAGFFLAACQASGHQVKGIEISQEMCDYARGTLHVDCQCGDISAVAVADNSLDLVAMWHVLEHIAFPSELLAHCHDWLKPAASIAITVPNLASGNAQRQGADWHHLQPEVHLNHFTQMRLTRLLEDSGFEIVMTQRTGGSGLLGDKSALPSGIKNTLIRNFSKLQPLRNVLKQCMVTLLRRDDFITVVAQKT